MKIIWAQQQQYCFRYYDLFIKSPNIQPMISPDLNKQINF